MSEIKAFSIKQFCEFHNLPQSTFFKLQKEGKAPKSFKAGRRRLISEEAAAEWRREMEASQS